MSANLGGGNLSIVLRPRRFSEVIGLEDELKVLRNILAEPTPPRVLLFEGPFGCGKTTLAYITARELQGWELAADENFEPVVEEINAADVTGIDAIRDLIDKSGSYPMVGKYKVNILDEAHKLSKPAQEALLKVFENPNSPTIWIVCTTEPDKLIAGWKKGGRLPPITVRPMDEAHLRQLVARAVEYIKHEGDVEEFVAAARKAQLSSPRPVLTAFELFHNGMPASKACNSLTISILPEYKDVAFAVVFGKWDSPYKPWGPDGPTAVCISTALKELDDKFKEKAKPSADTEEQDGTIEDGDLLSKDALSQGLRIMVAGFLKGQMLPTAAKGVYKQKPAAQVARAYKALRILVAAVPSDAYGIQWPLTIAALYDVNRTMQDK